MGVTIQRLVALAALVLAWAGLWAAAPARAAEGCGPPGAEWERADPAAMGMDPAKLQAALDYGTSQLGFAIRVYRRGCLVGEDRAAPLNRGARYESFSMAKSVTSLMFGRAMTLGLVSPDDPVGSLVPEADRAHGEIAMRDLLTMSSGVHWNGFRDYNVFTPRDDVRDALTLPMAHKPGTYFEYAQTAVTLLAKAVERAVGEDPVDFLQRKLLDPLGIEAGSWVWERDAEGNVEGFYGVKMHPDDYARLGELLRRGGVWRGQRLLSSAYVSEALTPSETNGCYGWLIWLNSGAPCIGPTVVDRTVSQDRDFPGLPADMYKFSGLFGQLVTVFPSQEIVVARLGQDPGLVYDYGAGWERGLYDRVLAAIVDQEVPAPGPAKPTRDEPNTDYGFQTALLEPEEYSKGVVQDPLPPAGPERARAPQLSAGPGAVDGDGGVAVRLGCPPRWLGPTLSGCHGVARLTGARDPLGYEVAAGGMQVLRFQLPARDLRRLDRRAAAPLTVTARNRDPAGGTTATLPIAPRTNARR